MKKIFFILLSIFSLKSNSQVVVSAKIINGDTIPFINLEPVYIVEDRTFSNILSRWRWTKLVRNVKKAYPYAKIAGKKVNDYNQLLSTIKSEVERKKTTKKLEDELIKEFEKDIRDLTHSQGVILLKLIDRQTNHTSYQLLQQFKGNTKAFMWQSLARLFGNNLKQEYDSFGTDKDIEEIVQLIDAGII